MTVVDTPQGSELATVKWSRFVAPAGVSAALGAAAVFVATHNPHTQDLSLGCIMLNAAGVYCPACGGTRAFYELSQGNVAGALHMNALMTLVVLPLGAVGLAYWWARAARLRVPAFNPPLWTVWLLVGAGTVFWILRNLPGFEYLRP